MRDSGTGKPYKRAESARGHAERGSGEWRVKAKPPSSRQLTEAVEPEGSDWVRPPSRALEGRRSRSPLKRYRRGDSSSRARGSSSVVDQNEFVLGATGGVVAGGAWAARWEIASLLESRCDPCHLIRMIRAGEEDGSPLVSFPFVDAASRERSTAERQSTRVKSEMAEAERARDETTFSDMDAHGRKEALSEPDEERDGPPPWATGSGSKSSASFPLGPVMGGASSLVDFEKKAQPPLGASLGCDPAAVEKGRTEVVQDREVEKEFQKKAVPPVEYRPYEPEAVRPPTRRSPGPKLTAVSMADREIESREVYFTMTLTIYDKLKAIGVEMDLPEIVEEGRSLDLERFKTLTAPNRAATGLGYARLMMRLLNWHETRQGLRIRGPVDAKLGVLDFTEHLMQEKSGFMTPRTFLYAVDYYGKAFGYVATGSHWFRAKRLADYYAKSKTRAPRRAPGF